MPVTELPPKPVRSRDGKALHKGQQTKAAIVDTALALATQVGLEGLSIGALAEAAHMSKSGVFAHFGSREELQISVVRAYQARFEQEVFLPALAAPRGVPRLRALFANWMKRISEEIDAGCIYIGGAVEFDDRPGPVRDALVASVQAWLAALRRAIALAREEGHLDAAVDCDQLVFEVHGLILALHHEARFLRNPAAIARADAGFENILQRCAARPEARTEARPEAGPEARPAARPSARPAAVPAARPRTTRTTRTTRTARTARATRATRTARTTGTTKE